MMVSLSEYISEHPKFPVDVPTVDYRRCPEPLEKESQMDQTQSADSNTVDHAKPDIDILVKEHRTLDEKVVELSGRSFLSPDQDLELSQLKKEKLKLKDRIEEMVSREKSA